MRLRFGEANSRIERGTAHTGNNRTDVRLQWADIEALRVVPNLAVRIIQGSSHSDDQYTESWSSLEGTAAATDRTMAECGPEGSA